jgi:DNA-binding transcriptional regulator YdaS (Cro superfamily)
MSIHPITTYREARNQSRAEFAALLGVKRAMLDHVERGIRKFSAERAVQIELATGVPRTVLRPDLWAYTETEAT